MCLASSSCHQQAILEEEISVGRIFCKLVFDYQNFCLTKISRYTVVWLLAMSRQLSNKLPECGLVSSVVKWSLSCLQCGEVVEYQNDCDYRVSGSDHPVIST